MFLSLLSPPSPFGFSAPPIDKCNFFLLPQLSTITSSSHLLSFTHGHGNTRACTCNRAVRGSPSLLDRGRFQRRVRSRSRLLRLCLHNPLRTATLKCPPIWSFPAKRAGHAPAHWTAGGGGRGLEGGVTLGNHTSYLFALSCLATFLKCCFMSMTDGTAWSPSDTKPTADTREWSSPAA